jgi:hypothetical protein
VSGAEFPNPVVRDFTCGDGKTKCVVVIDSPFQLSFSYADPNGDAAMWHITARRGDGLDSRPATARCSLVQGRSRSTSTNFLRNPGLPRHQFRLLHHRHRQRRHESLRSASAVVTLIGL